MRESERLVQIAWSYESAPRRDSFFWSAMKLIEQEDRTFAGVAGYQQWPFVLGRGEEAGRVVGQLVSGNHFGLLGATPTLGRLLQFT